MSTGMEVYLHDLCSGFCTPVLIPIWAKYRGVWVTRRVENPQRIWDLRVSVHQTTRLVNLRVDQNDTDTDRNTSKDVLSVQVARCRNCIGYLAHEQTLPLDPTRSLDQYRMLTTQRCLTRVD